MPIRLIVRWLAPLLAALAIGIAWRAVQQNRVNARTLASNDALAAELRGRIAQREALLARFETSAGTADTDLTLSAPAAGAPPQPTDMKAGTTIQITSSESISDVDPRLATAADPALRALHLRAHAADLDRIWGPLLKQLDLPADKAERFKALLLTHEERRLDVTALAGEQKVSLGDPAIQKMRDNDGALLSREMRALLGPDLMAIYQPYRRSLELQPVVADVVASTYLTSTPLSFPQSQRLLEILSANSERRPNGFVSAGTIKWEAVVAQSTASGVFPPAVIDALQSLSVQRAAALKVGEKMDEISERFAGTKEVSGLWLPSVSLKQ